MLTWLSSKLASKFLPYVAIAAVVLAWTWSAYSWGYSTRDAAAAKEAERVAVTYATDLAAAWEAVHARETAMDAREKEINRDRSKVKIIRVPGECRLTDESHGLFLAQIGAARARLSGHPASPLPPAVPGPSP